jgi:hypothetical protein
MSKSIFSTALLKEVDLGRHRDEDRWTHGFERIPGEGQGASSARDQSEHGRAGTNGRFPCSAATGSNSRWKPWVVSGALTLG